MSRPVWGASSHEIVSTPTVSPVRVADRRAGAHDPLIHVDECSVSNLGQAAGFERCSDAVGSTADSASTARALCAPCRNGAVIGCRAPAAQDASRASASNRPSPVPRGFRRTLQRLSEPRNQLVIQ